MTMPTTNAYHLIAIPQKAFHEEIRPKLGTGFDRSFDQHLIELAASRAVSPTPRFLGEYLCLLVESPRGQ